MTQAASLSDRLSREMPELLELRRHLHATLNSAVNTRPPPSSQVASAGLAGPRGVGRTGLVAELGPGHGPSGLAGGHGCPAREERPV